MKNLKRKFLLAASTLAVVTTGALTIACSSTADQKIMSTNNNIAQGIWTTISAKPLAASPWSFDRSVLFGAVMPEVEKAPFNATQSQFVRTQNVNEPKLTKDPVTKENYYIDWSYESYKFEYAKAIILTLNDGQIMTFDSDEAEIHPQGSKTNPVVVAKSKNPKSINSQAFIDALNQSKKLQIRIKNGFFYTDFQGKKTSYEIKAEDFWASYIKTTLLSQELRQKRGGLQALDDKAAALSPANNLFTKASKYTNAYLYNIFGVDINQFMNEKTGLENDLQEAGKKLLTFKAFEGAKANFFLMFDKQMVNAVEFSPISQEYIAFLNQQSLYKDFQSATGDVKRFGVYTYGRRWEDLLYSGYFYINDVDTTTGTVRYKFNQNYVDAKEVQKQKGYVKTLNALHANANVDNRLVTEFTLGNIYQIPALGNLGDAQRKLVEKNLKDTNNRRFALNFKNDRLVLGGFVLTNPTPVDSASGESIDDYLFNDNYAKLVYGLSLQELAKGDKASNFFSAKSIAFREAIFAGINWQKMARQNNENLSAYLGAVPPDASVGGKDQNQAEFNTLREKMSELNTKNVLHYDAATDSISTRNLDLETLSNDQNNLQVIAQNSHSDFDQYKSAAFSLAQKEITHILDAEGIPENQKVAWTFIAPDRSKPNQKEKVAMDNFVKTLNSLDTKGRLAASFEVKENQKDFDDATRKGKGFHVKGNWVSDYDGIGTSFDGMTHRARTTMLPYFSRAVDETQNAWIKKLYPHTYQLAQELNQFVKQQNAQLNSLQTQAFLVDKNKKITPMKEWKDFPNKIWSDAPANATNEALNADHSTLLAIFFTIYQANHTNEELLGTLKEFNEVLGFVPGRKLFSSLLLSQNPTLQAINKSRILPVSKAGILYIQDLAIKP